MGYKSQLHKHGFKLSTSTENNSNDEYYNILNDMPIQIVPTQQGTNEWHLCHSFSFISSTMLELMTVLNWYNLDWSQYLEVKQFYSKHTNE